MIQTNITVRKKDNSWQCIVSYKHDLKWKQTSKQGFKTKQEAKAWGQLKEKDLKNVSGNFSKDYSKITFQEYFDLYINEHKSRYSINTINSYENSFNSFKELKDKRMIDISDSDIQYIIDLLVKRNLKANVIVRYYKNINRIFERYKKKCNPLFKSPLHDIVLPKDKIVEEKLIPTDEEYKALLKRVQNNRNMYLIVLLAGSCGLRYSECLGLTWDRIEKDYIKIDRQWGVENGAPTFTTLKTKNSYRKVPLSQSVYKELQLLKNKNERVIPVGIYYKSNLNKAIKPFSIHALRHYYCTKLIANNVDFKTTAALLGHTVEMTMKIYSHVTNQMYNNAANKIVTVFDDLFDE